MLLDERPRRGVYEGEARLHAVEIELGAAEIWVGLDAAIGDCEGASVGGQRHVVGADTVSREFADPGKTPAAVIDADHAAIAEKSFSVA